MYRIWVLVEEGLGSAKVYRMSAGDFVVIVCLPAFEPRARAFSLREAGSVKSCGLTMRAADGGESARF